MHYPNFKYFVGLRSEIVSAIIQHFNQLFNRVILPFEWKEMNENLILNFYTKTLWYKNSVRYFANKSFKVMQNYTAKLNYLINISTTFQAN